MNSGQVRRFILSFRGYRRYLFLGVLAGMLAIAPEGALAQGGGGIEASGTGGRNIINGRIYFPSGRRSDAGLKIRLESSNSGGLSVFSDSNGSFSFRNLEPGNYTVIIEGGEEYENVRESVYIENTRGLTPGGASDLPRSFTLPIYLQPRKNSAATARAAVINAELAKAPQTAQEFYKKALIAIQSGDAATAVDNLRAAISIFPEFSLALNELGVQYLKLGQASRAIEPLKAAVKLTPTAFTPRLNYGVALLEAKHFTESQNELKEAVKLSDSSGVAHMYLGLATINQRADSAEEKAARNKAAAVEFLRSIELGNKQVATSHYYLAGIYWGDHEYKKAADELELYLKLSPKAPPADRKRAQDAIAELRTKY